MLNVTSSFWNITNTTRQFQLIGKVTTHSERYQKVSLRHATVKLHSYGPYPRSVNARERKPLMGNISESQVERV